MIFMLYLLPVVGALYLSTRAGDRAALDISHSLLVSWCLANWIWFSPTEFVQNMLLVHAGLLAFTAFVSMRTPHHWPTLVWVLYLGMIVNHLTLAGYAHALTQNLLFLSQCLVVCACTWRSAMGKGRKSDPWRNWWRRVAISH